MTSVTLETRDYDVVVIGAGPTGTAFASWVKRYRPETSVAVVDKRSRPGYKIGESTISTTINPIISAGATFPVLRRLFHEKLGLHFWWSGRESDDVGPHINVSRLDETFQLERPVFEALLVNLARRGGVDVQMGAEVLLEESDLDSPVKELVCVSPGKRLRFRARLVCDASGPASIVSRYHGVYRKDFDSFNTNAYFGYFRRTGDDSALGIPQWGVVGTRHLLLEQGWLWFIDIASWRKAPPDRLDAMIDHLLELPAEETGEHPSRAELSERFGCPVEKIYSIGIVPRADTDTARDLPVEERFAHYVERYPGLARVMANYELIDDAYDEHPTIAAYRNLVHYSERYAGDGWLAVGDAAFFVNPLFSPGLAYGFTMTHVAARAAVDGLDSGDLSSAAFAEYDALARDIFAALLGVNEMLYRSAAHPESFERCLLFWITHNLTSGLSRAHGEDGVPGPLKPKGNVPPPTVGGVLDPTFTDCRRTVIAIQRDGEAAGEDPGATARKVAAVIDPFLDELKSREAFRRLEPWRVLMDYDEQLVRRDPSQWRPLLEFWECPRCGSWQSADDVPRCVACGLQRGEAPG